VVEAEACMIKMMPTAGQIDGERRSPTLKSSQLPRCRSMDNPYRFYCINRSGCKTLAVRSPSTFLRWRLLQGPQLSKNVARPQILHLSGGSSEISC
jgi:hypothetical protein